MKKGILFLLASCAITSGFAQFNKITLYQTSNNQQAQLSQDGQLLQARVSQHDGDGQGVNGADTRQFGYNHSINADQSGSYNQVYLTQVYESASAQSRQVGTQNRIASVQRGSGRNYAGADFYQNGSSNQITLNQVEDGSYMRGSSAQFYQSGLENNAFFTQRGGENSFRLEQNGANNTAGLSQEGTANEAIFIQRSNNSTIQGLDGRSQASQVGSFNSLDVTQIGAYQQASISQNGYNNIGIIHQTGSFN